MEKYLRDLHTTWSSMEFEQEIHARTGCSLLRASEELIETLEENQVFKYVVGSFICDYKHQGNCI
jgi:Dynein heavy chain, N-terminal region 2.